MLADNPSGLPEVAGTERFNLKAPSGHAQQVPDVQTEPPAKEERGTAESIMVQNDAEGAEAPKGHWLMRPV
jgi:hypothetical protein